MCDLKKPMTIAETDRLWLRRMCDEDAPLILELVNEPAWLESIGDRGVRNLDDARAYIAHGPVAMVARCGFGLAVVIRKIDLAPLGICGLLKRDELDDADLGLALLTRFAGQGYAREAAMATVAYGFGELRLERIVAITSPGNARSIRLLESIGFAAEGLVNLADREAAVCRYGRRNALQGE